MTIHIRAFAQNAREAKPGSPISFIASTGGVARDGLVIDQEGWDLKNFEKNPVILWSHDYRGDRPPIGKAENLRVDKGELKVDVVFDSEDEFAASIERKYRNGFLNAVSVGWDTKEMNIPVGSDNKEPMKVVRAELIDISAVNIPGDPDALAERQKRAWADHARALLADLDAESAEESNVAAPEARNTDPLSSTKAPSVNPSASTQSVTSPAGRASWEETATAMVDLFRPYVLRTDEARKADYEKQAREYARLGKTAPEFKSAEELEALDVSDIRGLFLEGEAELLPDLFAALELRAGKVLSARNADDLSHALTLIQGVLNRSQAEQEQADAAAADEAQRQAVAKLARAIGLSPEGN